MSRPPWLPSGNQVVQQLVIAAVLAGAAWWIHRQVHGTPPPQS